MKKYFKISGLLLGLAIVGNSNAQDEAPAGKIREVYLGISSLTNLNLSITYKKQIAGSRFLKLGFSNLFGSRSEQLPKNPFENYTTTTALSGGTSVGLEFRKPLSSKLTLFQGPNLHFGFQSTTYRNHDTSLSKKQNLSGSYAFSSGISYTLGLLLQVSPHILFAIDVDPYISYSVGKTYNGNAPSGDKKTRVLQGSFYSQSTVAFVYRF